MESGFRLGGVLVEAVLATARGMPTEQDAMSTVARQLPRVRHLDLMLLPSPDLMALGVPPLLVGKRPHVPRWFAHWLSQPIIARSYPVVYGGTRIGQIVMIASPFDEMREVWGELCLLASELAIISVAIVVLIMIVTRRSLRPLTRLAQGFEALEDGDHTVRLGAVRVLELQHIAARFDRLAERLQKVTQDNHHLIDRLMSVQEAERREVAHELHDEFGPAFFGIRAELASITRWCREHRPQGGEGGDAAAADDMDIGRVEARAEAIRVLVDSIQRINANMLERLRPMVLEEMGLPEALRRLVDDWRRRLPGLRWDLTLCNGLEHTDNALALTLFRLVQECLTNIARHARAGRVAVGVLWLPPPRGAASAPGADTADQWLGVYVLDDGVGFAGAPVFGYGLLGMTERVRAAGGRLHIGNNGAVRPARLALALPPPDDDTGYAGADGNGETGPKGAVVFADLPWKGGPGNRFPAARG